MAGSGGGCGGLSVGRELQPGKAQRDAGADPGSVTVSAMEGSGAKAQEGAVGGTPEDGRPQVGEPEDGGGGV